MNFYISVLQILVRQIDSASQKQYIVPISLNKVISNYRTGILVGGSAGQGILQCNTERLAVARAFIAAADARITVIIHAGKRTINLLDRSPQFHYCYG
jgi:hypothetical protein